MLRRAPTTITLTSSDIEQYEANRQRKLREQALQREAAAQSSDGSENSKSKARNPNDELKPFPGDKKKDRIMGTGR
jgi:hypothetical protein